MSDVVLIIIGDELLSGKRQDLHLRRLSGDLAKRGAHIAACEIIRDEPGAVSDCIKRHLSPGRLIITTGGLGPTVDDLTREGVAEATGVGLEENEEVWKDLQQRYEKGGRKLSKSSRSQMLVPEKGTYFINRQGTAPGLAFEVPDEEGCRVVAMPGPPRELNPMWENQVLPFLVDQYRWLSPPDEILLRFAEAPEANIDEKMRPMMESYPKARLSSLIRTALVDVTLSVSSEEQEGRKVLIEIKEKTLAEFGDYVYEVHERFGETKSRERELEEVVSDFLRERDETLAVAESCTGGMLGKQITDFAGSSDVFLGGFISYHNRLKLESLGVRRETLERNGSVSEETAKEMAQGARSQTGADWGIGVTGVAGPGGGTEEKPVGLVFISVAGPRETKTRRREFSGDREGVRERSVVAALRSLWLRIRNGGSSPK